MLIVYELAKCDFLVVKNVMVVVIKSMVIKEKYIILTIKYETFFYN